MPLGDCFLSICHAEMVVTDPVRAYGLPALFFHFLQHFLLPPPPPTVQSSPRAFILRCVTPASLSSPGSAPRLQSPGSVPSVCLHPPLPPSLPTCMCSLGFHSITLKLEAALSSGGSSGPPKAVLAASPPGPPPTPNSVLRLWKHTCLALLPVQMLDRETAAHESSA